MRYSVSENRIPGMLTRGEMLRPAWRPSAKLGRARGQRIEVVSSKLSVEVFVVGMMILPWKTHAVVNGILKDFRVKVKEDVLKIKE